MPSQQLLSLSDEFMGKIEGEGRSLKSYVCVFM